MSARFSTLLAAHRRTAEAAGAEWKTAVYQEIETQREGGEALTLERMCALAGVSRAGFYRFPPRPPGPDPDLALRDALQRIALEFPSYGWARMRRFDKPLISQVPDAIRKVERVMGGAAAEPKNAVYFLQMALEHLHPLISGLLCVMGLEARFDSKGRQDFARKLKATFGSSTPVFPDWNSPGHAQPTHTVDEIAVDLYTLRSKIAHGVDLRKAADDKVFPVDSRSICGANSTNAATLVRSTSQRSRSLPFVQPHSADTVVNLCCPSGWSFLP
jgi:hypothetical protein